MPEMAHAPAAVRAVQSAPVAQPGTPVIVAPAAPVAQPEATVVTAPVAPAR
jgi:hypothetical protein